MIVEGNHEHGHAIAEAAGTHFNPRCDRVVANVVRGKLLGGVIFTGFTVAGIGLHSAGFDPHWLSRDMLWMAFHYPFEQLGVRKITGTIHSGNRKAILFDLKLGFTEETRVVDLFPDGDLIIMSMRREDCRWLKLKPRGAHSG